MSDENESEDVSEKRITLLAILEAFNAPIKFDQAWAIIYIVSYDSKIDFFGLLYPGYTCINLFKRVYIDYIKDLYYL